jgi:hypothetical protein
MLGGLQNVVPIGRVVFPHPANTLLVRAAIARREVTRWQRNIGVGFRRPLSATCGSGVLESGR